MHHFFFITLIITLVSLGLPALYPHHDKSQYAPDYSPDCALVLTNSKPSGHGAPHMSEGLQYITNYIPGVKRSNYYPEDEPICITFEDINRAIHEAKESLGGYLPPEIHELSSDFPKPPHVSVSSEILLKATQLLAKWFHLSRDTILFGLPRIDTYKTAVRDICPTFLQPVKCEISKYRTLTGMCNNLEYPSWGSARSAMVRFLPPAYYDTIQEPRRSVTGAPLPSSRLVSFVLHHDIGEHDPHITFLVIAWGQMLDHDLTGQVGATGENSEDIECCKFPPEAQHPACYPIKIPYDDPFFKFFRRHCMDFVRSLGGPKPNCPLGPKSQINSISSFIDANFVYGSSQDVANRLREFVGGRLKTTPLYRDLGIKDLLPMKTEEPEKGCERHGRPKNLYCFDTGDDRGNEQIQLTVTHTVFMREHNRIADTLYELNPHWNDEYLYQETRRIIGAMVQHITFNEYIPIVIGRHLTSKYELDLLPHGYYNGYDVKVNPGIRSSFQAAAYRFGHSILPDVTERYNKFHEKLEAIRLSVLLKQPYELYKPGIIDSFMLGLINQESYRMDPEVTTEVTNHLFEKPGERFGLDLAALNIQRGREMGIPGYNDFREYCGLGRAKSFYDLAGTFDNRTIQRFQSLYSHVDDIDLWSAGLSEYTLPDALVGPVFACIIGEQFTNLRKGDRFWYENSGWPSSFTSDQLQEIRKVKIAKMLCDNSDDIETIQLYPMLRADPSRNPRVYCKDLPPIDLTPWKEHYSNEAYKASSSA